MNLKVIEKTVKELDICTLKALANDIRIEYLERAYATKSTHIGSSFSAVEMIVYLYCKFLNISSENKTSNNRDRFILSKGHVSLLLGIVLCKANMLDKKILDGYGINGGSIEHHPRKNKDHGIELSTGSLGLGLSVGVGMALAGKKDNLTYKTVVFMGDGELNEGTVWEGTMFAAQHQLHNLIAIVDYNKIQALGNTKDIIDLDSLPKKWEAFGWNVFEINGHDYTEIDEAVSAITSDLFHKRKRPSVIISNTIKGKGVSFMENNLLWHYRCPDENEYYKALKELKK